MGIKYNFRSIEFFSTVTWLPFSRNVVVLCTLAAISLVACRATSSLDGQIQKTGPDARPSKCVGHLGEPYRRVALNIIIDDQIYLCGSSATIIADRIEFKPGAFISTGYPEPAKTYCLDPLPGQDAGSINLIARDIPNLALKANGQEGADVSGCRNQKPFGSTGGNGGNVSIRWLTAPAELNLRNPPTTVVDRRAGKGGLGTRGRGHPGQSGHYSSSQFRDEVDFVESTVSKIPELAPGLLRKAELEFLAEDTADARKTLELIRDAPRSNGSNNISRTRAAILLERINNGRDYFNFGPDTVQKLHDGNKPLDIDGINKFIESISWDLKSAKADLEYRTSMKWNEEQAYRTAQTELAHVNQKITDLEARFGEFDQEISAMTGRIEASKRYILDLQRRAERLRKKLSNLPGDIRRQFENVNRSFSKVTGGLQKITNALSSPNPLGGFLGGLSDVSDGIARSSEALNAIMQAERDIERELREIKDKSFAIGSEIRNDEAELRMAISRREQLTEELDEYTRQKDFLTASGNSKRLEDLERLRRESERTYLDLRMEVAEQVHLLGRYFDYLLLDGKKVSFAGAPGGIDNTLSFEHFLLLKNALRSREINVAHFDLLTIPIDIDAAAFEEEFSEMRAGHYAAFLLTDKFCMNKFAKDENVRIWSVKLEFLDQKGRPIHDLYKLRYTTHGAFKDATGKMRSFSITPVSQLVTSGTVTTAFAFEHPTGYIEIRPKATGTKEMIGSIRGELTVRAYSRRGIKAVDPAMKGRLEAQIKSCSLADLSERARAAAAIKSVQ